MSPRPARDQAALRMMPSKPKPAARATFWDAVLPVTVRSVMRANPRSHGPVEAGPGVRELGRSEAQVDLVAPDGVHVGRVVPLEWSQHQPLGRQRDQRERAIGRHRAPRIPASSTAA